MIEVHVIPVTWASHKRELTQIRQTVFVEEQNILPEVEFDAEDSEATHLLALDSTGTALGCTRLLDSGHIGRVAVLEKARGRGIGKALMEATIEQAQSKNLTKVFLHSQDEAQAFYKKLDFVMTGQRFMEAGIAHVSMERALPIPFDTTGIGKSSIVKTPGKAQSSTEQPRASRLREFADDGSAIEQLEDVLGCARRTISIYSPTLDHVLFDRDRVVELVSNFARSAPGCQVNILISDSTLIVARGHLLIELGRRLEQKMILRKLPDTLKADAQSWLVADNSALWVQSEPNEYQGWSDTFNPVQAERFAKRYTHLWDRSIIDPELRILQI